MKSALVFQAIEQNWNNSELTDEIEALLQLKAKKTLSGSLNHDLVFGLQYGINFLIPFEVLFLKQVRDHLGLPTVLPKHPLLELPPCHLLDDYPASGYNSHILRVIEFCQKELPTLSLPPWEQRFSELPPTEFVDIFGEYT